MCNTPKWSASLSKWYQAEAHIGPENQHYDRGRRVLWAHKMSAALLKPSSWIASTIMCLLASGKRG